MPKPFTALDERRGIQGRGARKREAIIEAAFEVLQEVGYAGFSLQQVTEKLGISLGNLTYHFPAREMLVRAMVDHIVDYYSERDAAVCERLLACDTLSLEPLVDWLLDEVTRPETSRVYPELWAMGNHDPHTAQALRHLYQECIQRAMRSLGVDPDAASARELRAAFWLLETLLDGCIAVCPRMGDSAVEIKAHKGLVKQTVLPVLDQALRAAVGGPRAAVRRV